MDGSMTLAPITYSKEDGWYFIPLLICCSQCNGRGYREKIRCKNCLGTGREVTPFSEVEESE